MLARENVLEDANYQKISPNCFVVEIGLENYAWLLEDPRFATNEARVAHRAVRGQRRPGGRGSAQVLEVVGKPDVAGFVDESFSLGDEGTTAADVGETRQTVATTRVVPRASRRRC